MSEPKSTNNHAVDMWVTGCDLVRLGLDSQAVMSMRLMGMAGLWHVSPKENTRMVTEKSVAFVDSAVRTGTMIMRGGTPDAIINAAMTPYHQKTRANKNRLQKSGIKFF